MAQYASSVTVKRLPTVIFTPQSRNIDLDDWFSLLTLCLAPVVMHIVAGAPSTVYLHHRRPAWHDRLCHYNPTSILWRYFAILDRRIRAKAWDSVDMAASNASFWTENGWNGSEMMVEKSRKLWAHLPSHARVDIFSASVAKTIVVTLQGVQAIYIMLARLLGKNHEEYIIFAMDSIFFPLAVIGLFRLPSSLWLTDNCAIADTFYSKAPVVPNLNGWDQNRPQRRKSGRTLCTSPLNCSPAGTPTRFYPTHSWRSVAVRIFFLFLILGLWALTMYSLAPWEGGTRSSTNFAAIVFYLFLLSVSLVTMGTFFILGNYGTTVIPCISSFWYKVYTFVIYSMMVGLIIIAALESRLAWCGKCTSFPPKTDALLCKKYHQYP